MGDKARALLPQWPFAAAFWQADTCFLRRRSGGTCREGSALGNAAAELPQGYGGVRMGRGYLASWMAVVLLAAIGVQVLGGTACTTVVQPGASIQEAIDAAPTDAVVCLAAGAWEESLLITKGLVLRGQGAASVIRGADDGVPVLRIVAPDDTVAVEVVVEALAVVGAREQQGVWVPAVDEPPGGPPGILVAGAVQAAVLDCHIYGNFDGIRLTGAANVELSGNVIRNNFAYGIYSDAAHEAFGSGNRMSDNGVDLARNVPGALRVPLVAATEGQIVFPDERYPTLQHAVDALLPGGRLILREGGHPAGVTITKAMDLTVEAQAEVSLHGRWGGADMLARIWEPAGRRPGVAPVLSLVGGARVRCTGVTVTAGRNGFLLGNDAWAEIEGCTVAGNDGSGIALRDGSWAAVTDTTVAHNGRGICLRDAAQASVTRSLVLANGLGGGVVLWDTTHATVRASTIAREGAYALRVHDHARATIRACEVLQNHHGLWLTDDSQATITESTVAYNTGLPSIFVTGAARATVDRCTVLENRAVGIAFVQRAHGVVRHTTIVGNLHGMGLSDQSHVEIKHNRVVGNAGYGVFLQEPPCADRGTFAGRVAGLGNTVDGAAEHEGRGADVLCPPELVFLTDEQGGEVDRRP